MSNKLVRMMKTTHAVQKLTLLTGQRCTSAGNTATHRRQGQAVSNLSISGSCVDSVWNSKDGIMAETSASALRRFLAACLLPISGIAVLVMHHECTQRRFAAYVPTFIRTRVLATSWQSSRELYIRGMTVRAAYIPASLSMVAPAPG